MWSSAFVAIWLTAVCMPSVVSQNISKTVFSTSIPINSDMPFVTGGDGVNLNLGTVSSECNVTMTSNTMVNSSDGDKDINTKIPLYLSGYFSLGGAWDGSGIVPAVEMALDHINERADVLAEYELRMIWNDTQCDAGLGTQILFDHLFNKPQKIMIVGPACSTTAESIAQAAYHWNLVTMSYSAASPALSNRKQYPYFYRTYMPASAINPARIRLMKEFGWQRVATIHYNHELFALAVDDLLTRLIKANITIITSESFAENPKNQVANIKNQDAKIIVAYMYESNARKLFCEAYKQGMTGEDYVWMLIGWYSDKWWTIEDEYNDCTAEEIKQAVLSSMYIGTELLTLSTKEEPVISGITPQEYVKLLEDRMTWPENQQYTWNGIGASGYDATWAIGLMLNKSTDILREKDVGNKTRRLEDFTYNDSEMARLFFDLLGETDFIGVTGPVSFRDGDRVGITQIEQLQARCEEDWQLFKGNCYQCVMEELAFAEAEQACQVRGGHLVTITNQEVQDFLTGVWANSSITNYPLKWLIGLTFAPSSMNYTWVLPHSFPYLAWQPVDNKLRTSGRTGDCVYVDWTHSSIKWESVKCTDTLPFICQKPGDFNERQIGLYTTKGDILDWETDIIWRGGNVPLDHTVKIKTTIIRIHEGIGLTLYIAVSIPAGVGIIIALFFLRFNIKFRKQRFVKMSSPNLNNLILLGSIFIYLGVFFAGVDRNINENRAFQSAACQVRAWVFSVGFVLAFGAMFSKTWRVHRVAAFKTPIRRIVTDNQLFAMVFVFFIIDVCMLSAWQIFDPLFVEVYDKFERDDPDVPNQRIIPFTEQCTCYKLIYWLVPLYVYKGLLLLFGTFLAWETRKVTIPALNDSKLIAICVYNVIVLCIVGVSVSFLISSNPWALFIFTSSIVIFCTTLTLIVLFLPKVISVYKFPEGEPIKSIKEHATAYIIDNQSALTDKNEKLQSRVNELEAKLREHRNGNLFFATSSIPGKDRPSNGCGMWCGPLVCGSICGCCASAGQSLLELYSVEKPEHGGVDNHGAIDI